MYVRGGWTADGRLVHAGFTFVTAVAVVTHATGDAAVRQAVFISIIILPVLAVFAGMRLYPALDRPTWAVAVVGLVLQALMQLVWPTYFADQLGRASGGLADLSIAGAHLFLLLAAVLLLVRRASGDPGGVIDAAIVGLCSSGPLWELVLRPELASIHAPRPGQAVILLDVVFLGGVLGALVYVAVTSRRARPTIGYLLVALFATLTAITVAVLDSSRFARGWQDEILIVAFLAFGAAPLHPSISHLMTADSADQRTLDRPNLAFLGAALTVFPVLALGQTVSGRPADPMLFGIGSLVAVPLVVIRIAQLAAQRERAERVLEHHARHDELTGLLNRRATLHAVDLALDRVAAGALDSVAVLFCDLDGFKPVNDRLGHQAGDDVLQVVAARLAGCLRDGNIVGRFGGDEFMVVCPGATDEGLARIVERVERAVREPIEVAGTTVSIGVSIGVAVSHAGAPLRRDALVSSADARMYQRKHGRSPGAELSAASRVR
jgi:diguanylate cyclase (GGDEF)-like protein